MLQDEQKWLSYNGTYKLLRKANHILEHIAELKLPPVKPNWADLTDAGPGVGVSNYEVRFRDAELARVHRSDYRVRVHRSRGDSGQNEAERTNSAISDSVVDGSTIDSNFYKRFDDLMDKEIAEMTPSDFEIYEKNRMSKNAWRVAEILRERVDDAPVLGNCISALLTEKKWRLQPFFSIKRTSRSIKMQPNRRNQMFLEAAILRRFLSLSRCITKLENFSLSTRTAAVVPKLQNIVLSVLIEVGQVHLCCL